MTELLKKAVATLNDLNELTRNGDPDPVSVLKLQSDLVKLYMDVGIEKAERFSAKERAYIHRKIRQAEQYQSARIDLKMTGGQADHAALLAVGEELNAEVETAKDFELYGALLRSIQNAIDYARQTVSFYRKAEGHPPPPDSPY